MALLKKRCFFVCGAWQIGVGNKGSRPRFNYTMMGCNVNLAARLESGAAGWGAGSMCTEATRAACAQHGGDRAVFRPLGRIVVVGQSPPLPIHEIMGFKESIKTSTRECLRLFEEGLSRDLARDWDGAIRQFQQSAKLEPFAPERVAGVTSNPSLVYIDFCQQFKANPPPDDWNGVYMRTVSQGSLNVPKPA